MPGEDASLAGFAVRGAVDCISRRAQAALNELGDGRLVFDDQYPHVADCKPPWLALA